MITQADDASSSLALHSSDSHPPMDLAAIKQESQSNMQVLDQLFPVIIKHNNSFASRGQRKPKNCPQN